MTKREFVENLFNENRNGNPELMDIETAENDLNNFRLDGWDIPEDLTADEYAEIWNSLVEEEATKIMEKYIVIHEINGDSFTTGFDNMEDAITEAQTQWRYLTRNEKKKSHIYVLESANPDVEADNHLDGNVVYEAEIIDEAILELYKYLSMETSTENIQRDMQYGYLTENTGRDGDEYWWYFDEPKGENVAVNTRTLDIVSDEDEIRELFE